MQYPSGVRKPQQNRYEIGGLAFSLLEILIALSLLAMTLGGIFKLWPTSQRFIFEAEQKRNATLIAQRIIETLKVTSPNGIIALSSDWVDNPSHCIRVELSSPSEHVIAYDASGIPQCERSIAESLNSLREKNIVSVARITIGRALLPGLAPVFISVGSPAVLPDQQRHHTEFTSFLSMPPPRKESSGEGSS
jgi:type II secretory pathway pseudopilin PulG